MSNFLLPFRSTSSSELGESASKSTCGEGVRGSKAFSDMLSTGGERSYFSSKTWGEREGGTVSHRLYADPADDAEGISGASLGMEEEGEDAEGEGEAEAEAEVEAEAEAEAEAEEKKDGREESGTSFAGQTTYGAVNDGEEEERGEMSMSVNERSGESGEEGEDAYIVASEETLWSPTATEEEEEKVWSRNATVGVEVTSSFSSSSSSLLFVSIRR